MREAGSENVITSRVRLARNLRGLPFKLTDERLAERLGRQIFRSVSQEDEFRFVKLSDCSDEKLCALKEKNLISNALIDNRRCAQAIISSDNALSVMIGEEDVIREQCVLSGTSIREAYVRLQRIDDKITRDFDVAFSEQLGYLTACPTNVGTGLRASVMMFLPALTESGNVKDLVEETRRTGLTVRGAYGEGSDSEGYLYQISNEVTLGFSEDRIISEVEKAVRIIVGAEREETEKLFGKNRIVSFDKAKRAFGILKNALLLSYEELLSLVTDIRIGRILGLDGLPPNKVLSELIIGARPFSVREYFGDDDGDEEKMRADFTRRTLAFFRE